MKKILPTFLLFGCLFNIETAMAQSGDSLQARIIVVGDAGEFDAGNNQQHPVLADIREKANHTAQKANAIIYLGDNIYPIGMRREGSSAFSKDKAIIDSQWIVGSAAAKDVYFIPGNHDWARGRAYGLQQLNRQADYINGLNNPHIRFLPENGCPGPEEIKLTEEITLVLFDSQWWLQQEGKPGPETACACHSYDEVLIKLKEIVYRNRNKLLLFAAHHPFYSDGIHGGYFTWQQHVFPLTEFGPYWIPLPGIGSLYPLVRGGFGNIQDLKHPLYKAFTKGVDDILKSHPYCIRLAGHEHGLQYLVKDSQQYVISGAGAKKTRLRKGPWSQFNAVETGYVTIEQFNSGRIRLQYEGVEGGKKGLLYSKELPTFSMPVAETMVVPETNFPDSITVVAAPYYKAGPFKKWLLGSNYRQEWTAPVRLPVMDIRKEQGGLTPTQRGGGMQSRSLRLEDSAGREYALRSIEKYPDKTLPEALRETFVKDVIVDGISASYPFGAVSVPPLATAANVPYLPGKLVYLPDDPALGQYRSDFKNGIYLFEMREPANVEKSYSSTKMEAALRKDNDNEVNQQEVLKARLLDMFIMDFDRHEDQWRWKAKETKDGKTYAPIPRDRDQAFFISTGVLPRIISQPWLQPKFQGFRVKARNINRFNYNARWFDRLFLTEPDAGSWQQATETFLRSMSDSVIETALQQQPVAVQSEKASWIVATLKARRQFFTDEVMEYYRFLSKTIDITGSDKRELFSLDYLDSGAMRVRVYKINKRGERSDKKYDRLLDPAVTKEIRLYGLGGDDVFRTVGGGQSPIRVRIIGGTGTDSLQLTTSTKKPGRILFYDQKTENNVVSGDQSWQRRFSKHPAVNDYDPHAFKYNITAPLLSVAYNPDDGVFLGAGIKNTRQGFRKSPFAIQQRFTGNKALATGAYNFQYRLEAIGILPLPWSATRRLDLLASANAKAPDHIQNYFGFGNETEFPNKANRKIDYYRSGFNIVEAALLLRAPITQHVSFLTGPLLQRYTMDDDYNIGRFITSAESGLDQATLYDQKSYFGWQFQLIADNRNNNLMPSRGVYWNSFARLATGINQAAHAFQQYRSDFSFFTSFSARANIVFAARIGAGGNHGRYEFFQAQYLSGPDNLRGFRKYRFAGQQMAYNNLDLRIRMGEIKGYIFPATIGAVFFHDIGRVWQPGEQSGRWHNGYGAGIWLAPAGMYVFTVNYALSKDGGLPSLSLGFQF
ncbi:MAG: BamA/TamA family outer membrane protein [Bacteroidetes bacterium]|nr:BamA/TamA family outer membrane protein [Bacteroidota bacterium]